MAVTVLEVVRRVCRVVGLDPAVSAFSDDDETNDILQDVNEAYEELLMTLPPEAPYLNASGSLSLSDGVRLYSLAADAMVFDVYTWSFENETDNDTGLRFISKEAMVALDPRWDEVTGRPRYVYPEGDNQVGFYPIPDGSRAVNYQYGRSLTARLSDTTDTFILPDRWVRFVEKRAQEKYERRKLMGEPEATRRDADLLLSEILVEAWESNPTYFYEGDAS